MKKNSLLPLFFLLSFSPANVYAQNSNEMINKGEILITNWNPDKDLDAVQISQLNLKYSYFAANGQPVGKFILQWQSGNYVIYNGERYLKDNIGDEPFRNIFIKSIKLKADVFSSEKLLTSVFIHFPELDLTESRPLNIVNNLRWESLFEKTSGREAAGIFDDGFELRNLLIYDIEFDGFDRLADSLKLNPKEKEISAIDYNEPAQLEQKKTYRKKTKTLKDYFLSDFQKGKKNSFRGLSWHGAVGAGLNYLQFPLVINSHSSVSVSGFTQQDSASYAQSTGSIHTAFAGGFWPFFGNYVGLGIKGAFAIGGAPLSHSSYMAHGGVKLFAGAKEVKLAGEFFKSYDQVQYLKTYEKLFTNGKSVSDELGLLDDFTNRIAFGPRFSFNIVRRNYPFENRAYYPCDAELMLVLEKSKNYSTVMLVKLNIWMYSYFNFGLEVSPQYPLKGKINYDLNPDSRTKGLYLLLYFNKTFDFFGRPYLKKRKEQG